MIRYGRNVKIMTPYLIILSLCIVYTSEARSCYIGTSSSTKVKDASKSKVSPHLLLISLPSLDEKAPKVVKDVYKWKDNVLGDGRDFFVFRPRALRALSNLIVGKTLIATTNSGVSGREDQVEMGKVSYSENTIQEYTIEEVSILSNCARLDLLLSIAAGGSKKQQMTLEDSSSVDQATIAEVATSFVASCLLQQMKWHQSQLLSSSSADRSVSIASPSNVAWEGISSFLDLPGRILDTSQEESNADSTATKDVNEETTSLLASRLCLTHEIEDIIRHFSLIASGIALRPSSPNTPVKFRPFSSRDAHIMLQLKRTADLASHYPRCKLILDCALSAGKAARDEKKVPIISKLRGYDGEGRYRMPAPVELALEVQESVQALVIEPTVSRGVNRLKSLEYSAQITELREAANAVLNDVVDGDKADGQRIVNRLLHQPMLDIRASKQIKREEVLELIRSELLQLVNDN